MAALPVAPTPTLRGWRTGVRALASALAIAACGFAQAPDGLARLIADDSLAKLTHADPTVRGEAALITASRADQRQQATLLAMAKDPEPEARHRALLGLGLLATPAAIQGLESVLADHGTRSETDGVMAAFGLGLVPEARASTTWTRVLSSIAQGSWKRQRDTLLALLLAMRTQPDRSEVLALRRLFFDDSNRDPEVRGALLLLLLPIDADFDAKALRRLLDRGDEPERLAVLGWLAAEGPVPDVETRAVIERIANHAESAAERGAALHVLTRLRHPPALDLAVRGLRSNNPGECAQAMRSLLALGGARMSRACGQRILDETDAARKAAWLTHYDAPLSDDLAAHCGKLAIDGSQPWSLRHAAVLALARSDSRRAAPFLRDHFRTTRDVDALPALALAMQKCHDEPVELSRLCEGSIELHAHPKRWTALLAAEHPEAQRQVLACLQDDKASAPRLATCLRAWRTARVLQVPTARDKAVPVALRELLSPP